MTTPAVTEHVPAPPWHRRPVPLLAVGLAALAVRLPPARLHRLLTVLSRGARPAGYREAAVARGTVVALSTRCAGLGCLQRSVATALLCRLRGTWPDWCTGFRTRPFAAHAWVEAGGTPVAEPGDLSGFRTVLSARAAGPASPAPGTPS